MLRALPAELVTPQEQVSLDHTGPETPTPHMIAALALYRKLNLPVQLVRELSSQALPKLLAVLQSAPAVANSTKALASETPSPTVTPSVSPGVGLGMPTSLAPFHLAYIDGLHTSAGVLEDTLGVLPLMHPNGVLVQDDVEQPFAAPTNALFHEARVFIVHGSYKTDAYLVCPGDAVNTNHSSAQV